MNVVLCVGIIISLCGSLSADDDWIGFSQSHHRHKDSHEDPNYQEDNHSRDHHHRDHHCHDHHRHDHHRHDHQRYDHHFDHDYHIEKPCVVHDLNCIRNFFANNFKCSPVRGPVPDPYIIKEAFRDIPHANMSITTYDAKYTGFNSGKFKKFYVNKKTGMLVVEVEFDRLVVNSPKTVMTFYGKGKEPVQASDFILLKLKHLSLTLNVQLGHHMNPVEGHVFAYVPDPHPPFKVGPGLDASKGHAAGNMKWLDDLALTIREALATQGSGYLAVFLQSKICDFRHH